MISQIQLNKDFVSRIKRLATGLGCVSLAIYLIHKSHTVDPYVHSTTAPVMLILTAFSVGMTGLVLLLRTTESSPS